MRILKIISYCLLLSAAAIGQTAAKSGGPTFDIADFNKKFETAQWLAEYDEVAWKTTDVAMSEDKTEIAKLGPEWFCFQDDKKIWRAVYGKLSNGRYDTVFHYTYEGGKVIKSQSALNQSYLANMAKSLSLARSKLFNTIPDNSPRFNQYIRKLNDGTFGVWLMPAFQPDGTAVYGGEAYYQIDADGAKITKEETYFQPAFRGFKSSPPREIWLNFTEIEKPTLGSIFFVWYYRPYFTKINIETSKSVSTLLKDEKTGYFWVHVEKEKK